jgi:polysaccharide biosynthesis transport protein
MMVNDSKNERSGMTARDWWLAVQRRSSLLGLIFAAVFAVVVLLAFLWPATYVSSGTILIEQQEVPAELVRSTISSYADQRIQVIRQQVMRTENLMRIIQKYDLYTKERKRNSREFVLEKMRRSVDFEMISADVIDPRSGSPTKATIAFSISYKSRSPDVAARVANEIVSLYLQQNIESRKESVAGSRHFLTTEADRLNGTIGEMQSKLAQFKLRNVGDLPELSQLNIQMRSRSEDELRETDTRIRSLDQQLVYLDAQLAQIDPVSQIYASTGERVMSSGDRLKYLRTELARVRSLYAPDHPDVLRLTREVAGLENSVGTTVDGNELQRQLLEVRTQLSAAQQRYSDDHPDVVRLQRSLTSLQQQMGDASAAVTTAVVAESPDNPAYIQINAQRAASINERASLQEKRQELNSLVAEYDRRQARAPDVERQYASLLADLHGNQQKYQEVRQKQMEAEVAENLEDERKGERFSLIEPPLASEQPYSPNRVVILVLGLLLAIGSAVGSIVILELSDTRVRNRRDLESLLHVPALAVLPWIKTHSDRRQVVKRVRLVLAGAIASVLLLATVIHFMYRPLDVLWQIVLRRLTG